MTRVARVWRGLPPERRLAAAAAFGLFFSLFLPWYQETVVVAGKLPSSTSLTGWAAFSFVEAAVLLVAAGVLTLLFQRGEGRAFHLPGGDGWVITAAGGWTCALVIWRILDKSTVRVLGPGTSAAGVEWGIFVALGVGVLLAYSGSRIRAAARPEPPLPDEEYDFSPLPRRRAQATATTAAPLVRDRARPRPAATPFPAPEPLADPPTLRLRRGDSNADEQLTIPFDELDG